jgi:hypothetical protein
MISRRAAQKGSLAADSTVFSTKRYETWLTIRKGRRRARIKLRTTIDLIAIINSSLELEI